MGEEGVLDWAVEHLSPWAVKELLELGEPVTMVVITTALNALDEGLFHKDLPASESLALAISRGVLPCSSLAKSLEKWTLLLPKVETSLELRNVVIECFLRRNIPGDGPPSHLSWDLLSMDRVFQADLLEALREAPLPMGGLELIVGIGEEEPVPCLLAPVQIAWEQGRPDICLSFLRQGLSIRTTYPDSLWPTWTLEIAVIAPYRWEITLCGDAYDRAIESLDAYEKAGSTFAMETLRGAVREQMLELSLPAVSSSSRVPRF